MKCCFMDAPFVNLLGGGYMDGACKSLGLMLSCLHLLVELGGPVMLKSLSVSVLVRFPCFCVLFVHVVLVGGS